MTEKATPDAKASIKSGLIDGQEITTGNWSKKAGLSSRSRPIQQETGQRKPVSLPGASPSSKKLVKESRSLFPEQAHPARNWSKRAGLSSRSKPIQQETGQREPVSLPGASPSIRKLVKEIRSLFPEQAHPSGNWSKRAGLSSQSRRIQQETGLRKAVSLPEASPSSRKLVKESPSLFPEQAHPAGNWSKKAGLSSRSKPIQQETGQREPVSLPGASQSSRELVKESRSLFPEQAHPAGNWSKKAGLSSRSKPIQQGTGQRKPVSLPRAGASSRKLVKESPSLFPNKLLQQSITQNRSPQGLKQLKTPPRKPHTKIF
ncbi:hypothetical protein [Alkalibacillus aidingensis]|uniref:hypothetical protein n=1 Tax=Alkalibacillus aidingensis TaxID=2747607 RepID=UPI0016609C59|nr:hypothetical protein [Alkalibacillus aidingensis]